MKLFTLITTLCMFAFLANAQQATFNWVSQEISSGNNLKGMTLNDDGSAIIIGYGNTLSKSTDNGSSWPSVGLFNPEFDFPGMSKAGDVVFMSSRRSKIVDNPTGGFADVYVSGVLLKSEDFGASWEIMDVTKYGEGDDASINPNADGGYAKDIYAVGALNSDTIIGYSGWYDQTSGSKVSRGAVFRTNDGGSTWSTLTPDLGSNVITSVVFADSTAIFGGLKNLFITNLNTDSVTNIYPNLAVGTDSNLYVNNITIVDPQSFYVITTTDGIFKTEDGGQTFTKLTGLTSGSNDLIVINDSTLVALGSSTKSKLSTDSGATWVDCYPGSTCYKIGGVLGDTLYGLAKSVAYKCAISDLIAKAPVWSTVELFDNENLMKMAIFDDNKAVIGGNGENCMFTSDGGQTWQNSMLPTDYEEDVEFDFNDISSNGTDAYTTVRRFKIANFPSDAATKDFYMEGLLLKSNDNWETSTILDASKIGAQEGDDATKNPQLDGCWGLNPYTIECVDANTAYLYALWYENIITGDDDDHGRVFKTADGGNTWSSITKDFEGSYITDIKFDGETGYIGGNKVLQKTTDGGATVTDLFPAMLAINGEDSSIFVQALHMVDANELYVPTTSDGVFITTDGGATFTKFVGVSGTSDVLKLDHNSFMCLGSTSKSFFTNDGGTTWQNASAGKTIYCIGEILNDTLYSLGNAKVYKIALTDLELSTSTQTIVLKEKQVNVFYRPTEVVVYSTDKAIERCCLYTSTGQLVTIKEPNSKFCEFSKNEYKPGIYIVATLVEGKKHSSKIVIN